MAQLLTLVQSPIDIAGTTLLTVGSLKMVRRLDTIFHNTHTGNVILEMWAKASGDGRLAKNKLLQKTMVPDETLIFTLDQNMPASMVLEAEADVDDVIGCNLTAMEFDGTLPPAMTQTLLLASATTIGTVATAKRWTSHDFVMHNSHTASVDVELWMKVSPDARLVKNKLLKKALVPNETFFFQVDQNLPADTVVEMEASVASVVGIQHTYLEVPA